jgi:hypothetical protein
MNPETEKNINEAMSPEEQRVAIAKACGWKKFTPDSIQYTAQRADGKWGVIPDYPNDLNAMHRAFEDMDPWLHIEFVRTLLSTYRRRVGKERTGAANVDILHATAPDWAEAFLRTLNLWTE